MLGKCSCLVLNRNTLTAMRNLKTIFNLENPQPHMDIAMEGIMDGNSGSAFAHCVELLFDEFNELPQVTRPCRLFRFVGVPSKGEGRESIITDVIQNRITLGNPENFNDPMDPIIREWLKQQGKSVNSKIESKTFKLLKSALKRLRICSLSGYKDASNLDRLTDSQHDNQYLKPLMWSHYANSHKGICIEYEITPPSLEKYNNSNQLLRLCPVAYRSHKPMDDGITLDNALLAKADCWEYEKEARLIYYSKDMSKWIDHKWDEASHEERSNKQKLLNYISLEDFQVKAVYFGCKVSKKDFDEINSQLQVFNTDVQKYKMKFCEDDITRLEAVRIDR